VYRFIIKRVLMTIPILLGVMILVFTMINIVPGDPGRAILGISAKQEDVDRLNHDLGYNRPFLKRLGDYLANIVLRFDFGNSYVSNQPVMKPIMENVIYTFRIVLFGTLTYVVIGIPLGVMSAIKQYSLADNIVRMIAMTIQAMPNFWLGMLLILLLALKLNLLPSNGVDSWVNYLLPVGIFGISASGSLLRETRTIMLEAIRQDYIRTARAKGAPERDVIWKHAFRNVTLPLINGIGISFGSMMGGTVLTETVFAMPGLGSLALSALRSKDVPLVMATTVFLSAIFCLMVLVVDIVSALVDPRVKAKYVR